jgi:hypothetical protein
VGLVGVFVGFVYVFGEPLTLLCFLLAHDLGAALQMLLELLDRNEEALLIRTLDFILSITAMSRTILGPSSCNKLALSLLPLYIELANGLLLHNFLPLLNFLLILLHFILILLLLHLI